MRRIIIIDPVFIEVFKPQELAAGPEFIGIKSKPSSNQYETVMAPGIYLYTVSGNIFTSQKNAKLLKH